MSPEEELREDISTLLDKVVPNNMFFRPLRRKLDWITDRIVNMSKRYVERKNEK